MTNILHASCVAFGRAGILIIGASGSGKSTLGIELIAIGGTLIADDKTTIESHDDQIVARCPKTIEGMIEARGIGLLAAPTQPSAIVKLVVDLDQPKPERLPPHRAITLLGLEVDVIYGKDTYSLAAVLKLLIQGGRVV